MNTTDSIKKTDVTINGVVYKAPCIQLNKTTVISMNPAPVGYVDSDINMGVNSKG